MATIAKLVAEMTLDARGFTTGIAGASAALAQAEQQAARSRTAMIAGAGALVGVGAAIGGGLGSAVTQAVSFQAEMANVNSLAQLSTADLADLSDQVLSLSGQTAQAPKTLATGLYDLYSSGFKGAQALDILKVSANAATAGLTTTDVSTRAITAAMNAYGASNLTAERTANVMFQTVNDGVLTFDDLANNLGNTLPLASSLGINIEELGAAYAQLTLKGINASAAETDIASLMRSALKPTDALTKAVQAQGYTSAASALQTLGLSGYVQLLNKASGGTAGGLGKLLGRAEALNAALILGANNGADYNAEITRMQQANEGAGAMAAALAKQTQSAAFKIRQMKEYLAEVAIVVGSLFLPGLTKAAQLVAGVAQAFLALSPATQRWLTIAVSVVGVVATLAGSLTLLSLGLGPVASGMGLFGAAVGVLLSPIGLLAAGVVALAAAFATDFLGVRTAVMGFLGELGTAITTGVTDFKAMIDGGINPVSAAFGALAAGLDILIGGPNGFTDLLRFVSDTIDAGGRLGASFQVLPAPLKNAGLAFAQIVDAVNGVITAFGSGGLRGAIAALTIDLPNIGDTLGAVARQVADAFAGFAVEIPSVAVRILGWVVSSFVRIWDAITGFVLSVSPTGDATGGPESDKVVTLGSVAARISDWVIIALVDLGGKVRQVATAAWDAVKATAVASITPAIEIADWGVSRMREIWSWVKQKAEDGWKLMKAAAVAVLTPAIEIADWALGKVADLGGWVAQRVAGLWESVSATAIRLGTVLVSWAEWGWSMLPDLWGAVAGKAKALWSAVATGAVNLGAVLLSWLAWGWSTLPSIWDAVSGKIAELWGAVKDKAVTLGGWTLHVAAPAVIDWAQAAGDSVLTTTTTWVQKGLDGIIVNLDNYAINVLVPPPQNVTVQTGPIQAVVEQRVNESLAAAPTPAPESLPFYPNAYRIGQILADAVMIAISAGYTAALVARRVEQGITNPVWVIKQTMPFGRQVLGALVSGFQGMLDEVLGTQTGALLAIKFFAPFTKFANAVNDGITAAWNVARALISLRTVIKPFSVNIPTLNVVLDKIDVVDAGPKVLAWAQGVVNTLRDKIVSVAGAIDWANGGAILSKIYDSLLAGVGSLNLGGVPQGLLNGLWLAISAFAGVLDWANGGGILSKIYDSLVAGVANINWLGLPGQIASSLWNAVIGWFAKNANIEDIIKRIPGVGAIAGKTAGNGVPDLPKGPGDVPASSDKNRGAAGALGGFVPQIAAVLAQAQAAMDTGLAGLQASLARFATDGAGALAGFAAAGGAQLGAFTTTGLASLAAFAVGAGGKAAEAAAALIGQVTIGANGATAALAAGVGAMGGHLSALSATAWDRAAAAGSGLAAGVTMGARQATASVAENAGLMAQHLAGLANAASFSGGNAGAWFAGGVQRGMDQATGAAWGGRNAISAALSAIDKSADGYWTGASFANGISAGILDKSAGIAAIAAGVVNNAINAAKNAAAIASPSRRTREEVGGMLGLGVALGIADRAAEAAWAMRALVTGAVATGSDGVERASAAMIGATGGAIARLAPALAGGAGADQRPVIVINPLKSEEYLALLRNAEEGGEFARRLGLELGLRAGV